MLKRILSLVLMVIVLLSFIPTQSFATDFGWNDNNYLISNGVAELEYEGVSYPITQLQELLNIIKVKYPYIEDELTGNNFVVTTDSTGISLSIYAEAYTFEKAYFSYSGSSSYLRNSDQGSAFPFVFYLIPITNLSDGGNVISIINRRTSGDTYYMDASGSTPEIRKHILYSTFDIYESLSSDYLLFGKGDFYDREYGQTHNPNNYITITRPMNGLTSSQLGDFITVGFEYSVPSGDGSKEWQIEYISDTMTKYNPAMDVVNARRVGDNQVGTASIPMYWSEGPNTLQVKMYNIADPTEFYLSNVMTWTRYNGFVDTDGDGLDDRTNEKFIDPDKWVLPESPEFPTESTGLFGWFTSTIKFIGDTVSYLTSQVTGVVGMFGSILSVVPKELMAMLTLSITVLIVLKIFGR